MCGIAGIVSSEGVQPSDLEKMSRLLKHRGPDDEGFLLIKDDNNFIHLKGVDSITELNHLPSISDFNSSNNYSIGFLHRRLSIIDLSAAAHQPMSYQNDNFFITYNGEIYNYKEIKTELLAKGYKFHSDSDTEVILASYIEWGKACINKFVGMWAFAIYDKIKKQVFLSRDRFGIKPLYYSVNGNKIAFASEIKALLALDFVSSQADHKSVVEYISYGAVNDSSDNLFADVKQVPPAHNLTIDINTFKTTVEEYYNLEQKVKEYSFTSSDYINSFRDIFKNSIDLHLRSDVPVGSCLSGGLDSSSIVAYAVSQMDGKKLKTFTASYHQKEIDESYFAKLVSGHFKNIDPYYTYPTIENYWGDLDKLTWYQDLPIHSTSMYAQWEVMKLTHANGIKVVINGQGSDEILGGYYNFAGLYLIELIKKGNVLKFFSEFGKIKNRFTPTIYTDLARALFYFMPESFQRIIRTEKRIGPAFISEEYKKQYQNIKMPVRGGKNFKEHSFNSIHYGLQSLLRYEDRNSMAFSVESRVPFLDHRLVEFSIALKNEWKVRDGWSKYILRKAVEPLLPKEVVWRKNKMGFLTPQKMWKKGLQEKLTSYVNETSIPEIIDRKYLLKLCSSDLNNTFHLSEFWKMISFLKWAEVFKVRF